MGLGVGVCLATGIAVGTLNNISVYWVADGKKLAQVALAHGGNDLVGTAFSEEVYRAAGKSTSSSLGELVNLVKEIKVSDDGGSDGITLVELK